jgi:hypothetical protein
MIEEYNYIIPSETLVKFKTFQMKKVLNNPIFIDLIL